MLQKIQKQCNLYFVLRSFGTRKWRMEYAATLPVLDFTDVTRQLRDAGRRIGRFATVIHNGYTGITSNLLYRVTVEAGNHTCLCIDAYQLAYGWFGVQATMAVGSDQTLCEAWLFNDAKRSGLDDSPALCIRCLNDCEDQTCPHANIAVHRIAVTSLADVVTLWVNGMLPDEARRDRTVPTR